MNTLLKIYEEKRVISRGLVNGVQEVENENSESSDSDDEELNTKEYEQEYVEQEMAKYASFEQQPNIVSDFDTVLGINEGEARLVNPENVYEHYNFNSTFVKHELPIDSFKQKIIQMLNINNVLVIQGDTGCGKSTQVPQFILDDCREKRKMCNIVVTQPRKIATINVARRVCEERGWALGTVCGYQIGLERKVSSHALITYMTTGVLLQKIIGAKTLQQYSHIIIDEVHERNQDLDFLLLVVRKFLFTNSPHTKVILMSATIDASDFAHYFRSHNNAGDLPAPIIYIDKKSNFSKQIYYADHLSAIIKLPPMYLEKPEITEPVWQLFTFIIGALDKMDCEQITDKEVKIGSALVFLPGLGEIEEANKYLLEQQKNRNEDSVKWEIIPLHSSLPNDEQAKVFKTAKPGHRKIILSTNLAESSITVADICFVIDFCLTKVMTVDEVTKYSSLQIEWASRVNCEQRAGRVGRVANGRVYRLVSRSFYDSKLERKGIPEILRAPLESVVLHAKLLNMYDTPKQILALAMDPPNLRHIESTIWNLKEVGGLLQTCRGNKSASDGDITFLGKVMSLLPLDVRLSKMIVLGYMFSCFEETIIMAAGCSIQNIFAIPFQQRFNAYKKIVLWSDSSCSDLITLLNLYKVWQTFQRDNRFQNSFQAQQWCKQNLVSLKGLNEWSLLIEEIKFRLKTINIVDTAGLSKLNLSQNESPIVLKVITCGAFYPNYYVRTEDKDNLNERQAVKTVSGRDPFRTVYLQGFDPSQPGELYVKNIKRLFKDDGIDENSFNVGFDGSSKIFIEFKRTYSSGNFATLTVNQNQSVANVPGKIHTKVYELIRKRQLKLPHRLKIRPLNEAWELADKFGIKSNIAQKLTLEDKNCFTPVDYNPIPSVDTEYISIHISSPVDAGHFWCQHDNEETRRLLTIIQRELNRTVLHPAIATVDEANLITINNIYAARWEDNKFYRCKVNACNGKMAYIIFIDFGNLYNVRVNQLYKIPKTPELLSAPLAIECVLSGIKPSLIKNPTGSWSDECNHFVYDKIESEDDINLKAKIYSVVDNVVSLELYYNDPELNNKQVSLNEVLLIKEYAISCKESFRSEEDHAKRQSVLNSGNLSLGQKVSFSDLNSSSNIEELSYDNFTILDLKGPFSPLEMKLQGTVQSSMSKNVIIDNSSVNSVLLDSEPSDPHLRLLVAGSVMQGQTGNNLTLRLTTLMPNIPGFPMIMTLLFCPKMEPKLIDDGSRVASVLCGMGCHDITEKAHYPIHDLSLILDTELRTDEIEEVNGIRFQMNSCIKYMSSNSNHENRLDQEHIMNCQRNLKDALFKLIYRNRKSVEKVQARFANVWKKSVSDALVLQPSTGDEADDIWPLLWFVNLNEPDELFPKISSNVQDMDYMAKSIIPAAEIDCLMCNTKLYNVHDIRLHLISLTHKLNFNKYREQIVFNEDYD